MTPDTWHLTPDTWHMTPDTWYVTPDRWHLVGGEQLSKFQLPSSFGLGGRGIWRSEGKGSPTDRLNYEGVYRTAPATPGLLIKCAASYMAFFKPIQSALVIGHGFFLVFRPKRLFSHFLSLIKTTVILKKIEKYHNISWFLAAFLAGIFLFILVSHYWHQICITHEHIFFYFEYQINLYVKFLVFFCFFLYLEMAFTSKINFQI